LPLLLYLEPYVTSPDLLIEPVSDNLRSRPPTLRLRLSECPSRLCAPVGYPELALSDHLYIIDNLWPCFHSSLERPIRFDLLIEPVEERPPPYHFEYRLPHKHLIEPLLPRITRHVVADQVYGPPISSPFYAKSYSPALSTRPITQQ
jgi:hypothetical protein